MSVTMDAAQFLAQRTKNARFHNERRVTGVHSGHAAFDVPSVGAWYSAPKRESGLKRTVETFAMKKGEDGKMHPTEGETSDNSDAGVCWSDYERVPGTEEGEKGSCRPKGGKKKKKKTESND